MKNLQAKEMIYTNEYDISIKQWLTRSELNIIIDTALQEQGTFFDKMTVAEFLLLEFATDIEDLANVDLDLIYSSGLMNEVKTTVENFHEIEYFIKFNHSYLGLGEKLITSLVDKIPNEKNMNKIVNKISKSLDNITTDEQNKKLLNKFIGQVFKEDDKK